MIQLASMKHLNDICKSKWSPWGKGRDRKFYFSFLIYCLFLPNFFFSALRNVIYECKDTLAIKQVKYRLRKTILQSILYCCKSGWEKNFFTLWHLAHSLPFSFFKLPSTIWLGNQYYLAFYLSSKSAVFLWVKRSLINYT